ncbi:MAG TPA: AAA family ATPase, partial [Rubricoccaceae bacterium]
MRLTLSDTLRQNLRAGVVGRAAERATFARALSPGPLPFHVVHLHGPGGVGKTTLLHEFAAMAAEASVPATLLDLRDVDTSPEGFCLAVAAAFA